MTMELYWGSGSPFAWRVMLALAIKKLPYDSKLLEFSKDQHKSPEYLKLNPRGLVPTLKDGAFALGESLAIIAYLDRKQPEPPLLGRSAVETGLIWRGISEVISYLDPPAIRVVGPIYFNKTAEKGDDIREAAKEVREELARMEQRLAAASWLATDSLSAADIVAHPTVESLLRAAGKDAAKPFDLGWLPLGNRYPGIAAWRDRIRALPGYDKTYPPHWRAADTRPSAAAS
jgi:glutathione S-transferase